MFDSCVTERINSWDWIQTPLLIHGASITSVWALAVQSRHYSVTALCALNHFWTSVTVVCGVATLLQDVPPRHGAAPAFTRCSFRVAERAGHGRLLPVSFPLPGKKNLFQNAILPISTPLICRVAPWGDIMRVGVAFSSPVRGLEPSIPSVPVTGQDPSHLLAVWAVWHPCTWGATALASWQPLKPLGSLSALSLHVSWAYGPFLLAGEPGGHLGLADLCLHRQISTDSCPGLREGSGWEPGKGDSPAAWVRVTRRSAALCPHKQLPTSLVPLLQPGMTPPALCQGAAGGSPVVLAGFFPVWPSPHH